MVFAQAVAESPIPKLVLVALVAASMGAVWVWWVFLGRKRLIQDTPTSAARGVALGLNELVGTVAGPTYEPSPQAGIDCVWWKNEFYTQDSEGNWTKSKEREGGPIWFHLQDESGVIAVRPRKAEVTAPKEYDGPYTASSFGHDPNPTLVSRYIEGQTSARKRKVVERVIKAGDTVYVLGTAQLPMDSLDVYVGPDRVGAEPFLVRVGSEHQALFTERVGTAVGFGAAVLAAAAAGVALADGQAINAGGFNWADLDPVTPLLSSVLVLFVMAMASVVFVYNGLMRLKQRAQAAWSLIDVQLRRRHDLIPNLASVVIAHAEHEASVQTSLAQLRASLAPDLPSRPSDDAVRAADGAIQAETAALVELLALVEAYPALTADRSYSELRVALVDTEDRVALAREFYNNSVQALHDRARVVPGALVAWIFELDLEAEFLTGLADDEADEQVEVFGRAAAEVGSAG